MSIKHRISEDHNPMPPIHEKRDLISPGRYSIKAASAKTDNNTKNMTWGVKEWLKHGQWPERFFIFPVHPYLYAIFL